MLLKYVLEVRQINEDILSNLLDDSEIWNVFIRFNAIEREILAFPEECKVGDTWDSIYEFIYDVEKNLSLRMNSPEEAKKKFQKNARFHRPKTQQPKDPR